MKRITPQKCKTYEDIAKRLYEEIENIEGS